nr:PREDICTED: uncharacterized protein LOC105669866 [Linepithema humile]
MAASRRIRAVMHGAQRQMAACIARSYRTVSYAAVTALAGMILLEFLAEMYADVYRRTKELRHNGRLAQQEPGAVINIKRQARMRAINSWINQLNDPNIPGRRTTEAIRPCLPEWMDRVRGGLTYRLTVVLSGHGCFGKYLCCIGKKHTTQCHHCAADRDSAQHTLEECPAWAKERRALVTVVGRDLSLPALVKIMLEEEEKWRAVLSFCEQVMLQKEEAEREKRGKNPLPLFNRAGGAGAQQKRLAAHLRRRRV